MIFTHQNVDLDACLSVVTQCLLDNVDVSLDNITFVPASQREFPTYATLIDLEIAKHDRSKSHLESYKDYLPSEIIQEVNIQDGYGYDPGSLQIVLLGLKKNGITDIEICQWFKPIVKGWMIIENLRKQAKPIYDKLPKVTIKGEKQDYKFVVCEFHKMPEGGNFFAGQEGCVGTIYTDKYNMGITRYPFLKDPDLSKLPHLRDWYQEKFLYCHGSRKNVATSYPAQFNNVEHFCEWLKEKFRDYHL